jgi:formate transporter
VLLSSGVETEGLRHLLAGFAFSTGFFFVVLSEAVLFTEANVVLPTTLLQDRTAWQRVLRFWAIAWVGNLLGAWLFGTLIAVAQGYGPETLANLSEIVARKLSYRDIGGAGSWWRLVLSGVLANWLVGMAAFFAVMGRTIVGKYIPVMLAVTLFVSAGFQHSPANMGYFGLAGPMGLGPGWGEALAWNLLPAGLGNMIGGALLGPIGALLALPVAAIVAALVLAYTEEHDVLEHGLTTRPAPRPHGNGGRTTRRGGRAEAAAAILAASMLAGVRGGLLCAALLLAKGMPGHAAASRQQCIDQEEACSSWADGGECLRNPGYMAKSCCASCAKHGVAPQLSWEDEDLTVSADGSAILDLTAESLEERVRVGSPELLIVWFYAPWCKQCKLVRPALEQAAQTLAGQVAFGRLDCVKHVSVKRAHGIYSYPAFKAFRAGRSRWVEMPKVRAAFRLRSFCRSPPAPCPRISRPTSCLGLSSREEDIKIGTSHTQQLSSLTFLFFPPRASLTGGSPPAGPHRVQHPGGGWS